MKNSLKLSAVLPATLGQLYRGWLNGKEHTAFHRRLLTADLWGARLFRRAEFPGIRRRQSTRTGAATIGTQLPIFRYRPATG